MTWHTGRMVAFDTETTGVDLDADRIVTAAVIHLGGGRPTEHAVGTGGQPLMLDPGIPIPDDATRVHGITTERARAEGIPAAEGIRTIVAELANAAASGLPIVAMNAAYDLTLLDREARRHGITPLTERGLTVHVLDPMVIDKHVDRYRRGKRTLTALCEHYAAPLDDAHNAAADALGTARVLYRLGQRSQMTVDQLERLGYRDDAITRWHLLGAMTIPKLHSAQIDWAREQAESLAAYFRRQGKHNSATSVRGTWPLIPVQEA